MILARTKLKELPDCCAHCPYSYFQFAASDNNTSWCTAHKEKVHNNQIRPDWCPLVEAKKDEERKSKWKTGHPEHDNEVLVLVSQIYQMKPDETFVTLDSWDVERQSWYNFGFESEVLKWCEKSDILSDLDLEDLETKEQDND